MKEDLCIVFFVKKNNGLPGGCLIVLWWKINILPNIIALHRDNDLKLKFVRGKKLLSHIIQGSQCKKNRNQSQQNFGLKKAYFCGHPVIKEVEAKMLGLFYLFPDKNQPIHYELR